MHMYILYEDWPEVILKQNQLNIAVIPDSHVFSERQINDQLTHLFVDVFIKEMEAFAWLAASCPAFPLYNVGF